MYAQKITFRVIAGKPEYMQKPNPEVANFSESCLAYLALTKTSKESTF
jgi:hypothetical protein